MNSVQLLGNLARDPEIRFTKTGRAVAMFTVACTRSYIPAGSSEPRELTDFIPCVAWGNLAENCGNNLSKGSRVFVQGRISVRSYETQDGQKRYRTEVVCDFVAQTMGSEHQQLLRHRMLVHRSPNRLHREPALTAWVPAQTKKSHSKRSDTPLLILEGGNYT